MILPEIILTLGVLGWFLIVIIAILLSIVNKYIGVLGIIILIIVGFDYWDYYSTSNSTSIYFSIFTWLVAVFLMIGTVKRLNDNRK